MDDVQRKINAGGVRKTDNTTDLGGRVAGESTSEARKGLPIIGAIRWTLIPASKDTQFRQPKCAFSYRNLPGVLLVILLALAWTHRAYAAGDQYPDGRPAATLRYNANDYGIVLHYGGCPGGCDKNGARDVWVFGSKGRFYMHYDAAGSTGWLTALATSSDLVHWRKQGTVLKLGKRGSADAAAASYGTTYFDGIKWHMFYLGTPHATPPPERIPAFPYLTLKAESRSPLGPWRKRSDIVPFSPKPGTYYSATASPGQIIRNGDEYLQFFSASAYVPGWESSDPVIREAKADVKRTIGIARTRNLDGPWTIDPQPIVPLDEQIENTSLYFEPANSTWFLFTNHIGIRDGDGEYTDAIWVYWSRDLNHWSQENKAVVLDSKNSKWSQRCIGLPSVIPHGDKLAIFYDAPGGKSVSHMKRSVGLAWLDLPLRVPSR